MPQKRITANQINTNTAGGLLEINGSGKVSTSFLETNVANGVAGLDASGRILETDLPTSHTKGATSGIAPLDGSGLLLQSDMPTSHTKDAANGIPSLNANSDLSLRGFDVTYNETRFVIGGEFSAGQECVAVKIGNIVTLSSAESLSLTHPSDAAVTSTNGIIPSAFRPNHTVRELYHQASTGTAVIEVNAAGTISLFYFDASGAPISRINSFGTPKITYLIIANIA